MRKMRRGKVVVLSTLALGLVVLVAAGFAAKGRIVEEWYLHQLESDDEKEQIVAARALGDMRSVGAIPLLVDLTGFIVAVDHRELWAACIEALRKIGGGAVPPLIAQLNTEYYGARVDAAYVLLILGPDAIAAVPALKVALEDEHELVRSMADSALSMIQREGHETEGR